MTRRADAVCGTPFTCARLHEKIFPNGMFPCAPRTTNVGERIVERIEVLRRFEDQSCRDAVVIIRRYVMDGNVRGERQLELAHRIIVPYLGDFRGYAASPSDRDDDETHREGRNSLVVKIAPTF